MNNASLGAIALNALDVLPRQNWGGKSNFFIVVFKLKDFFSINKQMTIVNIVM